MVILALLRYTFLNAIVSNRTIGNHLILGSLSCIIWTLTLQTTVKYVILTLRADNKGEGGIFSLYALVRRQKRWLVLPAMIGEVLHCLQMGIITPPISVTAAVEGLKQIPIFSGITELMIVVIVLVILGLLFFFTTVWYCFNRQVVWPDYVHLVLHACCIGHYSPCR